MSRARPMTLGILIIVLLALVGAVRPAAAQATAPPSAAPPSARPRRPRPPCTSTTTSRPATTRRRAPGMPLAPRLQNLGVHTFPVTMKVDRAQLFINQGLNLAYGFNHAEAGRAFAEAARLDPACAMAYWGQALVLGPNINAPMDPEDEPKATALARRRWR